MLAPNDIRLAQETIRDLRAQGLVERANVVESLLAAATIPSAEPPAAGDGYLTTRQAARALGVSVQTIKNWVAAGDLVAVRLGGRTLVHRDALRQYLDRLRAARPVPAPQAPEAAAAAERRRAFVLRGLPRAKLTRLEALHGRLEDGERLSRAERAEMVALERELAEAAGRRLEQWRPESTASAR